MKVKYLLIGILLGLSLVFIFKSNKNKSEIEKISTVYEQIIDSLQCINDSLNYIHDFLDTQYIEIEKHEYVEIERIKYIPTDSLILLINQYYDDSVMVSIGDIVVVIDTLIPKLYKTIKEGEYCSEKLKISLKTINAIDIQLDVKDSIISNMDEIIKLGDYNNKSLSNQNSSLKKKNKLLRKIAIGGSILCLIAGAVIA